MSKASPRWRRSTLTPLAVLCIAACTSEQSATTAHRIALSTVVDPTQVSLAYTCGTNFRIRNTNWANVPLSYKVTETNETGNLTVPSRPQAYPYNETHFHTNTTGTVQLSYAGSVIATQANTGEDCDSTATKGSWSSVITWPVVSIHTALLPTGNVLTWGRMEIKVPEYPVMWDPVNDPTAQHQTTYPVTNNPWCSGFAFLPNGNLVVAGGHFDVSMGRPTAFEFDPNAKAWTQLPDMRDGRWYPTATALANGEMLVESGTDSMARDDSIPEVLQKNGTWRELTTARRWPGYYPWNFQAPNGLVFSAGQGPTTQYINTAGTGALGPIIPHVVNTTRDYGSAVMYDVGKIIVMGGGYTERTAEVINLNDASPAWKFTGWMQFPRRQMNATLLADGQVLATGGGSGDFRGSVNPVLIGERWSPATGHWTPMAAMKLARLYHSSTVLLPDARVLSVGSGQPAGTGQVDQYNGEIYSPTYLFNPDGTPATASRPQLMYAPPKVGYGQQFTIWTQNVIPAKVLWIRIGATTHSFNENQRINYLAFTTNPQPPNNASTPISVTTPASPNLAPPGHYVIYVLNSAGVPSVGKMVQIQ
jgi:galactose oxidase